MADEEQKTDSPNEPPVSLGVLLLAAVGGRLVLNSFLAQIPGIEPVLPVAIVAGHYYGGNKGALIGFLGYFLSNLFLFSIGDWTIWQGLAGIIAGYIGVYTNRDNFMTNVIMATVIFQVMLNFYGAGYVINSIYFFGSLAFTITHIVGNIIFASLFKTWWFKAPQPNENMD